MSAKWHSTNYPGVRYYKHATRKHGVKFDQYFAIRYMRDGKRPEEGLGWASEGWTAEKAYEELASLKNAARTGKGERSLKEKREKRKNEDQQEEARRRKEITIPRLIDEYIKRHAKRKKKSWEEDQRALRYDLLPVWGDWLAKDVTRKDAADLLESIVERGAPVQACNMLEKCRKMFKLAVKWGYIEYNPFADMERPAPRPEGDRVLSDKEIHTLWPALADDNQGIAMSSEMRRAFKLLLLTGQRPGEVIGMHRREVSGNWWTIPKQRSKNGRAHRVYLTDFALSLIGNESGYIFPSPKGKGHIREDSMSTALQRNILGASPGKKVKGLAGRNKLQAMKRLESPPPVNRIGIDYFVPHDLRRTFTTGLASLGYSLEIRDRVVNHSLGKLEKTYNLYKYDREKTRVMKKWTAHVEKIISKKSKTEDDVSPGPAAAAGA